MSDAKRIERLERAVYQVALILAKLPWDSCTFLNLNEDLREIERQVRETESKDEGAE